MANTRSAKKSIRSALRKKAHNAKWNKIVKAGVKELKASIDAKQDSKTLVGQLVSLQKSLDKAAKEKTLHKNKANRIKSKYAKRIAALQGAPARKSTKSSK